MSDCLKNTKNKFMIPFNYQFTNPYCQYYELKCKQTLNNNLLVTGYIYA